MAQCLAPIVSSFDTRGPGYRCLSQDEAATLQALVIERADDPNWLFRQCRRAAVALTERNVALA